MKKLLKVFKLSFISLGISLIGFLLPLELANGTSQEIMQVLFGIEIFVAISVTLVFLGIKSRKDKETVKARKRSYNHNKRVEQSVDYYGIIASKKANEIVHLFTAA